jgi:hypothetical protein
MRAIIVLLTCALTMVQACSRRDDGAPAADVEPWQGELPIGAPWLKDRLPLAALAYVRIPHPLGLLAMPKGNVFDAALGSEANIRNVTAIREALAARPDDELPLLADPRIDLVLEHLRSPIEVVVTTLPSPAALIGLTLGARSNAEVESIFESLAQFPPFLRLSGPLSGDGFGQIEGLPVAAHLHFEAATGRLAIYGGQLASRQALESVLATPLSPDHAMRALENQVDTSGQGLFAWVNAEQAIAMGAMFAPQETVQMLQGAGLMEVKSMALGAGVANGKGRLKWIADVGTDFDARFLPVVSNQINATAAGEPKRFFLFSIPSPEEFARLETLVSSRLPPDAGSSWMEAKDSMAQAAGVPVEALLAAVGPELFVVSDLAGDYVGVRIRDQAAFDDIVASLAARAGIPIEQRELAGRTIRSVSVPSALDALDPGDGGNGAALLAMWARLQSRAYWTIDGDHVYLASVPQVLMDRIQLGADADVGAWLAERQRVDLSSSLLAATGSVDGLPRVIYRTYLAAMQGLADIAGVEYDIWSMPSPEQLGLPREGAIGLSLDLGAPFVSLELSYESNPAELLFGGGVGSVAAVGMLAAIAVPAYQDYTIRAQVAEGLNLAAAVRAAVTEAYVDAGTLPADRMSAGLSPDPRDAAGRYVEQVDVVDGRIVVLYGREANVQINGLELQLTPHAVPGGGVLWACGFAASPAGAQALGPARPNRTNVAPQYLPSACR